MVKFPLHFLSKYGKVVLENIAEGKHVHNMQTQIYESAQINVSKKIYSSLDLLFKVFKLKSVYLKCRVAKG